MTKIPDNPLVLVDGSSYLFRAYYAMPPLSNSSGNPTGAIYGVINMLKNLLKTYNPTHIAVVFDTKEKNFRHKLFPEYKANRTKMPEELVPQIAPLYEVIKAMGLTLVAIPGIEADDVIGVLATKAATKDKFVLISTGDKDMAQLVNDRVVLINTMNNTILDRDGVIDKFEIPPETIIDYLSLVGDSVDNIPGIEKVGPKTAVKWLKKYGSLDEVVKNADEITGKVGENLRDSLDKLELYRNLTTIDINIKIDVAIDTLEKQTPDTARLKELYSELEFKTWLKELDNSDNVEDDIAGVMDVNDKNKNQEQNQSQNYKAIITIEGFEELIAELETVELFAFDTETDSLNAISANLVGMSFAFKEGEAFYIPLTHSYADAPVQLDFDYVIERIKPLLENENIAKVGHNFKYDLEVLVKYGLDIKGTIHDTMLQSYVLNSVAGKHDMATCAKRELQLDVISFEEVVGKGKNQVLFNAIEIDKATEYAAEDADITLKLHNSMYNKLVDNKELLEVYKTIEVPLIKVLQTIEQQGVLVDENLLSRQSKNLATKLAKLEEQIEVIAGEKFNINSPKQLQLILFDKLGLPILQKTPKGQPSTAESVLQELSLEYELPKDILEYRSLNKLKSTYTDKLPEKISEASGRIHTSYHQAVTATGRLSSSDPNLQNIPIKTEEGRKIRNAFIAAPGYTMLSADYSQIELRIMAHLSNDKGLVDTFTKGEDVHRSTAAEVWDVKLEDVSPEQRRNAKAINFGLIYGMSSFGLAKQLGIGKKDAQEYIDSYFAKFPGVLGYMEETRERARKQGYVETMYGRRLYLPEINSRHYPRRLAAERAAINAPMQGAQADIIKLAMIKLSKWIKDNNYDIKMIMQVHDELVFEVKDEIGFGGRDADSEGDDREGSTELLSMAKVEIARIMTSVVELKVPLIVGIGLVVIGRMLIRELISV